MDKRVALRQLEMSLKNYYLATDVPFPDLGILLINLSSDGCDLQYIGIRPNVVVDWPTLFGSIIQEIEHGRYTINDVAEVVFES